MLAQSPVFVLGSPLLPRGSLEGFVSSSRHCLSSVPVHIPCSVLWPQQTGKTLAAPSRLEMAPTSGMLYLLLFKTLNTPPHSLQHSYCSSWRYLVNCKKLVMGRHRGFRERSYWGSVAPGVVSPHIQQQLGRCSTACLQPWGGVDSQSHGGRIHSTNSLPSLLYFLFLRLSNTSFPPFSFPPLCV